VLPTAVAGGQWEATMTTDGSTRTVKYCVSAAEADSLNGDSRTGRDFAEKKVGGRCAIRSFDIKGDKVSSSMLCGARSIEGTSTYHADTSEGDLTTTSEGKAVTTHGATPGRVPLGNLCRAAKAARRFFPRVFERSKKRGGFACEVRHLFRKYDSLMAANAGIGPAKLLHGRLESSGGLGNS
jgi:hypothetical protein